MQALLWSRRNAQEGINISLSFWVLLQAEQLSQISSRACHLRERVPAGYDISIAVRCGHASDKV